MFGKERLDESDMLKRLSGRLRDPVTPQNSMQEAEPQKMMQPHHTGEPYSSQRADEILDYMLKELNDHTPESKMVNVRAATIADEMNLTEQGTPELLVGNQLETTEMPTANTGNVRAFGIANHMRMQELTNDIDPEIVDPKSIPSVADSTRSLHCVNASKDYLEYEGHDLQQVSEHVTDDIIQCAIDVCEVLRATQMSTNKIRRANITANHHVIGNITPNVTNYTSSMVTNMASKSHKKAVTYIENSINNIPNHTHNHITNHHMLDNTNTANYVDPTADTNANPHSGIATNPATNPATYLATNPLLPSADVLDNRTNIILTRIDNHSSDNYTNLADNANPVDHRYTNPSDNNRVDGGVVTNNCNHIDDVSQVGLLQSHVLH